MPLSIQAPPFSVASITATLSPFTSQTVQGTMILREPLLHGTVIILLAILGV